MTRYVVEDTTGWPQRVGHVYAAADDPAVSLCGMKEVPLTRLDALYETVPLGGNEARIDCAQCRHNASLMPG